MGTRVRYVDYMYHMRMVWNTRAVHNRSPTIDRLLYGSFVSFVGGAMYGAELQI